MIWPKSLDVYLSGSIYSPNVTYLYIGLSKWSGTNAEGMPCKSDAEIGTYIDNLNLSLVISSAYFDFEDYNNPIKYYLDDHFYLSLINGFTVISQINVKESYADLSDSIFSYRIFLLNLYSHTVKFSVKL